MTTLTPNTPYAAPADESAIATAAAGLAAKGYGLRRVPDGTAARDAPLDLLPEGAEVFTAASVTAEAIGLTKAIDESGSYGMGSAVHKVLILHGDMEEGRIHPLLIDEPPGY